MSMARIDPSLLLDGDQPSAWSAPVEIAYDRRDVLLYAVGIGCTDLRFVYEGHPQHAVFPSFSIRWGGLGLQPDPQALPSSPGPMTIDAERQLEQLEPLPLQGLVQVRSRLLAVHPRGKGGAFVESETEVADAQGRVCTRITTGIFRRGVRSLGDIEPFEGRGITRSVKRPAPERAPDLELTTPIAANQAMLYRLSGDWNPLHIDPAAAKSGGFDAPILHGLCTYGHCAQRLVQALCDGDAARLQSMALRFSAPVVPGDRLQLRVWHDGPGRALFEGRVGEGRVGEGRVGEGRVGERVVVANAAFAWR